jgi:glyoxylase-like metal-dependent hydrolase (beta-lactamase superfamily II)
MLKRLIHFIMFGSIAFFGFTHVVYAEAPMVKTQVPGYYRMQLGQFEMTALYDGRIELDAQLLKNVQPGDLDRLLKRFFVGNPKMATSVNAYLINTGPHLVLVDAGAGKLFGDSLGHIAENIKAAGYDPSQVDTILITHMHGDHIGGLNDAEGKPVYPNANIFVAKAESDFWLSEEKAEKAPEEQKRFFNMARDISSQYLANGKWQTFVPGGELVPGIRAIDVKGHTPGHTAYVVGSDKQKLVIWGDVIHAYAVQFAKPSTSIDFDIDQKQAVMTRCALMKTIAADGSLVAGMHLPFPGIGHIRAEGEGSYAWVPIEFEPLPEFSTTAAKKSSY